MNETESFAGTFQVHISEAPNLYLHQGGLEEKDPVVPISSAKIRILALSHLQHYSRIGSFAENGAFWGTVGGLFIGCAFFEVPGDGPLLAALGGLVLFGGGSAIAGLLYSHSFSQSDLLQAERALVAEDFAS